MRLKSFIAGLLTCLFIFSIGFVYSAKAEQTFEFVLFNNTGEANAYPCEPEHVERSAWCAGYLMAERYPYYQLGTINGIPWQETPYAQNVKEGIESFGTGTFLTDHPELYRIVFDKRFNGRGLKVKELYDKGKSVDEIIAILSANTNNSNSGTNSTNPPVLPPANGKKKVVLYINSQDCAVSDGQTWASQKLDTGPVIEEKRTLIPLRGVLDQMGAVLDWDPAAKQVTVKLGSKEVVLAINSKTALVNGKAVTLDVLARAINGRTLIPVRFVSEQLGLNVVWDSKTGTVSVSK